MEIIPDVGVRHDAQREMGLSTGTEEIVLNLRKFKLSRDDSGRAILFG